MQSNWKNGHWYSYNDHLTKTFGEKVYKVTVSGGFTCPTRDGNKGYAGCAFCDEHGSGSYYSTDRASLEVQQQIENALPQIKRRFNAGKFLAYFQSFTNTYAPVDYLKKVYDGAFHHDDIVGMAVGTRPDALSDEALALLSSYAEKRYVSLELGIQSFSNEVQEFYMRGETAEEGAEAVARALKYKNLSVAIHLMFGAPMELEGGREQLVDIMTKSAKRVNEMGVHGVKIHQLMILKKTVLEKRYAIKKYPIVELDDYNHGVMAFLENLNPEIHVERTHGLSSHPDELVGPKWSANRLLMLNSLRSLMVENESYQGKSFIKS